MHLLEKQEGKNPLERLGRR